MLNKSDFLKRLRKYEALLDSRIDEINERLKADNYPPDGGFSIMQHDRTTIAAHRVAQQNE